MDGVRIIRFENVRLLYASQRLPQWRDLIPKRVPRTLTSGGARYATRSYTWFVWNRYEILWFIRIKMERFNRETNNNYNKTCCRSLFSLSTVRISRPDTARTKSVGKLFCACLLLLLLLLAERYYFPKWVCSLWSVSESCVLRGKGKRWKIFESWKSRAV